MEIQNMTEILNIHHLSLQWGQTGGCASLLPWSIVLFIALEKIHHGAVALADANPSEATVPHEYRG